MILLYILQFFYLCQFASSPSTFCATNYELTARKFYEICQETGLSLDITQILRSPSATTIAIEAQDFKRGECYKCFTSKIEVPDFAAADIVSPTSNMCDIAETTITPIGSLDYFASVLVFNGIECSDNADSYPIDWNCHDNYKPPPYFYNRVRTLRDNGIIDANYVAPNEDNIYVDDFISLNLKLLSPSVSLYSMTNTDLYSFIYEPLKAITIHLGLNLRSKTGCYDIDKMMREPPIGTPQAIETGELVLTNIEYENNFCIVHFNIVSLAGAQFDVLDIFDLSEMGVVQHFAQLSKMYETLINDPTSTLRTAIPHADATYAAVTVNETGDPIILHTLNMEDPISETTTAAPEEDTQEGESTENTDKMYSAGVMWGVCAASAALTSLICLGGSMLRSSHTGNEQFPQSDPTLDVPPGKSNMAAQNGTAIYRFNSQKELAQDYSSSHIVNSNSACVIGIPTSNRAAGGRVGHGTSKENIRSDKPNSYSSESDITDEDETSPFTPILSNNASRVENLSHFNPQQIIYSASPKESHRRGSGPYSVDEHQSVMVKYPGPSPLCLDAEYSSSPYSYFEYTPNEVTNSSN